MDGVPTLSSAKAQDDDDNDVAEGELLALQCAWDLCLLFSVVFASSGSLEHDRGMCVHSCVDCCSCVVG